LSNDKIFPLVSVGIITYNQEDFIEECIESVLSQNYPNFEIIIGDDASTDRTPEILSYYKKKYPEILHININNRNLGITKNSQIINSMCKGKYIAWMGGDDIMLPDKLKKQVEYMENNDNCYLCYHNMEIFDVNLGKTIGYFNNSKKNYIYDIKTLIKYGTLNCASSTMVKREKVPKYGYDERLRVASDWLYWIETVGLKGKIIYIDEVLGKYRRHSKNITNVYGNNINEAMLDTLNTINILLHKYPQFEKEILYRASEIWYSYRYFFNYPNTLKISLGYSVRLKVLLKFFIYYLSFMKLKL